MEEHEPYYYQDNDLETPSEDCPHCESDRKVYEYYNAETGEDTYRCLDCDKYFTI